MGSLEERIRETFNNALEISPERRSEFLDSECGPSGPLRERITALLEAYEKAEEYFAEVAVLNPPNSEILEFPPGTVVADRFSIVRRLGRGGSGDIYEARDTELNETIALKVLRGNLIDDEYADQFREEVRLARKIHNPHVCRVHDVGRAVWEQSTLLFLTMELIPGRTVKELLLESGALSFEKRASLVRQMAVGLDAAHQAGVVHGDFKSSNVMVLEEGEQLRAVIADFGLARFVGAGNPFLIGGTPPYMAPEQWETGESNVTTDIYSFGVLALETLSGKLASSGQNQEEIMEARRTGSGPELRTALANLPSGWNTLVERCLERDPSRRYPSMVRVLEELPSGSKARFSRREWLTALVVTTGAGAIVTEMWQKRKPDYINTVVVLPFSNGSGATVTGAQSAATVSAAQSAVAQSMDEQLANSLSKVPGLRVIAPTTAAFYANQQKSLASLGSELKVRSVLRGSVKPGPHGVLISAELSDTRSGQLLWSESYDMRLEDLRRAHETIARAVIRALSFQLSTSQTEALSGRYATNDTAYSFYLLGQHFAGKRDGASLNESIRYFSNAIESDSRWAVPMGALADAYNLIATKGILPAASAYESARSWANKALALDERIPEAHLALAGIAEYSTWDWREAERRHRRALELDPGSAETRIRWAGYLSMQCRFEESLPQSDMAVGLDALSIHVTSFHATDLYRARKIDAAIESLEWILRRDSQYVNAYIRLADCYGQKKRYTEALRLAQIAADSTGRAAYSLGSVGEFLGLSGNAEKAREVAAEIESLYDKGRSSPCYIAAVYRGLKEFDSFFNWLERGISEHDSDLPGYKSDPSNDPIREDRRFKNLLTVLNM